MHIKSNFLPDPYQVLYVPLRKLDGASFMSGDAYGHPCAATGASWRPSGKYFDGVDDYVSCGNPVALQLSSAFTILAWVNTAASTTQAIINKYDAAGNQRGYMLLLTGGKAKITVSSTLNPFTGTERPGKTTLSLDTWHHVAGVFIPSTNQDLYLNGQLDNGSLSGTIAGGVANPARDLAIGADYNNSSTPNNYWYKGLIGEVLICGRALTPLEIQQHYLATKSRYR